MKQIWAGRMAQAAGKYGEHAPMAAVCCNACRTCATTNIIGVAVAGVTAAGVAVASLARRMGTSRKRSRRCLPSARSEW